MKEFQCVLRICKTYSIPIFTVNANLVKQIIYFCKSSISLLNGGDVNNVKHGQLSFHITDFTNTIYRCYTINQNNEKLIDIPIYNENSVFFINVLFSLYKILTYMNGIVGGTIIYDSIICDIKDRYSSMAEQFFHTE